MLIPAAGFGSRLGLPYPKELHGVFKGQSLIDLSVDAAVESFGKPEEIVLVSRIDKGALNQYVREKGARLGCRVICVNNDDPKKEYTHSIELAAASANYPLQLLILPDSYIQFPPNAKQNVAGNMIEGASTMFYKNVANREEVATKGAIDIGADGRWCKYHDKPGISDSTEQYCGYWTGFFFFDPEVSLINEFCKMTRGQKKIDRECQDANLFFAKFGIPLEVEEYIDLGEWSSLHRFICQER